MDVRDLINKVLTKSEIRKWFPYINTDSKRPTKKSPGYGKRMQAYDKIRRLADKARRRGK